MPNEHEERNDAKNDAILAAAVARCRTARAEIIAILRASHGVDEPVARSLAQTILSDESTSS